MQDVSLRTIELTYPDSYKRTELTIIKVKDNLNRVLLTCTSTPSFLDSTLEVIRQQFGCCSIEDLRISENK